jgi:hypothetical protein
VALSLGTAVALLGAAPASAALSVDAVAIDVPAEPLAPVDPLGPDAVQFLQTVPGSPGNTTAPRIVGTAPAGSTVRLYIDPTCTLPAGAARSAEVFGSYGVLVTVPADSTTTFWGRASGAAGVSACSAGSVTYTQDASAPAEPHITAAPARFTGAAAATFAFAGEDGTRMQCSLSQSYVNAYTACDSAVAHAVTGLADGRWTFKVRAIDGANNYGEPAVAEFTVDTVAPAAPLLTGTRPALPANNNAPAVWGSAEPASTVRLFAGECVGAAASEGGAGTLAGGLTVPVPDDATTTLRATATDRAGNTSPCSEPVSYTEDSTGPEVVITDAPEAVAGGAAAVFAFQSEPGASFSCSFAAAGTSAEALPCSSPARFSGLVDGDYRFRVWATDAAGNRRAASIAEVAMFAGPALDADADELWFGEQPVGTASDAQTVTLRNRGAAPLAIGAVTLVGVDPDDFSHSSTCAAGPLDAGAECAVTVRFRPSAVETCAARVAVATADGLLELPVSGAGAPATVPVVRVPRVAPVLGSTLGAGGAITARVAWSATDPAGIGAYALRHAVGPVERDVRLAGPAATSATRSLVAGAVHRFHVTATSRAGAAGWAQSARLRVAQAQETAAVIAYAGRWSTDARAGTRAASRRGARATYRFTGTAVAWASTFGPDRGKVEIYVDGVRQGVVDLYAPGRRAHRIAFVRSGLADHAHTIQVRALGSKRRAATGTRVDVDAFVRFTPLG